MWRMTEKTIKLLFNQAYNLGFADSVAKKKNRDLERETEDWIDDKLVGKRRLRNE